MATILLTAQAVLKITAIAPIMEQMAHHQAHLALLSKKKEVSPQFSSFKDKAQNAVDAVLKKAVEKVITFTDEELKKNRLIKVTRSKPRK
nr:hypothetical protein [Mycoplasmopsis bovis]